MERSKVCIVLPTYNEAENIERTLNAIYGNARKLGKRVQLHVLVVDDNSPDGTARIVKQYMKRNRRVHLLWRMGKNGLGAAYIAGMTYALDTIRPDIIFEMDADLSHDPSKIPVMVSMIEEGADVVIGSRYIEGGALPKEWGYRRVFMSRSANAYARLLLRMPVKDCTGGFRAIRASALARVPLEALDVTGYSFQIVLLYNLVIRGCRVVEVPIDFVDRKYGKSKLRIKDMAELLVKVPSLRLSPRVSENVALG